MEIGERNEKKGERKIAEFNIQDAVDETGFGKFNVKMMLLCFTIYANAGFGLTSTGLILPSAACDFEMTTIDKGRLSATPLLGMVCGTYLWGCLADTKGRKKTLLIAVLMHAFSDLVASIVPNYWAFLFFKFIDGLAITGECTVLYPYLGEFQPTKIREKVLSWMELAWAIGLITIPIVGWAVIPLKFEYRTSYITFHSWNLFVLICALPPALIASWLFFYPESPKYLVESGQETKALEILSRIYAENTGNTAEEYLDKYINRKNICDVLKLSKSEIVPDVKTAKRKKLLKNILRDLYVQTKLILKPPYLKRTIIACCLMFSITSSYYTLLLWLPEMFQRFAEYEKHHPDSAASICTVFEMSQSVNDSKIVEEDPFGCQSEIQFIVYLHMLFLGLSCIPTSIWFPLCIGCLGYKFYLVFTTFVSGIVTFALLFVKSSTQNLILSCTFEALTSLSIVVVSCILVDLFPTNMRVTAAALSGTFGRFGALLGNLMFGYLLDIHCVIPIAVVTTQLLLSGILCLFVPGKKKMKAIVQSLSAKQSG